MTDIVQVLLKKDVRLEVPAVSPVVAEILGLNVFDARRIVRYARGLFFEEVERASAEKVCAALAKLGIETLIVPKPEYRELAKPRRAVTAELNEAGFAYKTDFRKPFENIPWASLSFVSAGIVATPHYRDMLSSKQFKLLPAIYKIEDQEAKQELREKLANLSLKKRKVAGGTSIRYRNRLKEDDLEFLYKEQTYGYIDIHTIEPWDHLRINRHEFRFDYLKEKASPNSLENFKQMVRDLVSYAKDSLISNMTMALVDGVEMHELVFDNLPEFDKYNTWFLHMGMNTLDTLGRAPTNLPEKDFTQASVEVPRERRGNTIYRKKPGSVPSQPKTTLVPGLTDVPPAGAPAAPTSPASAAPAAPAASVTAPEAPGAGGVPGAALGTTPDAASPSATAPASAPAGGPADSTSPGAAS